MFMSDHFYHVSDQFWLCSDILSGHLLFLIGNPACMHTHICIHANTHTYTHVCTHTCTHTNAYTYTMTCTRMHTHTHQHTHIHNDTHTYAHTYTPTHTHAHTHAHTTYQHTHICTHWHSFTHTQYICTQNKSQYKWYEERTSLACRQNGTWLTRMEQDYGTPTPTSSCQLCRQTMLQSDGQHLVQWVVTHTKGVQQVLVDKEHLLHSKKAGMMKGMTFWLFSVKSAIHCNLSYPSVPSPKHIWRYSDSVPIGLAYFNPISLSTQWNNI